MKKLVVYIPLLLTLFACDMRENEIEPGISFTKIYDYQNFSGDLDPLSVVQVADSGYLILAAKDTWQVYLLKTKLNGDPEWELTLDQPYVNALAGISKIGDHYHFACMDEVTLGSYLMKIDLSGSQPTVAASYPALTYPLSFSDLPSGSMIIQGYDRSTRSTTLTKINPDFSITWENKYAVLEDKEEILIKHLTRTGHRLPFFTGYSKAGTDCYYFNGFMNFTLAMVFIDPSSGELLGNINGFRDQGYINALFPLEEHKFALARTSFGDNYLLPNIELNTHAVSFSGDLETNSFPEISAFAKVLIRERETGNRKMLLFGTHSKDNQLVIYAYNHENGELLGVEHIGQTNPYEMGDFLPTEDGGLIILSKTYVAKRFPRLALFKLTKEEVEKFVR